MQLCYPLCCLPLPPSAIRLLLLGAGTPKWDVARSSPSSCTHASDREGKVLSIPLESCRRNRSVVRQECPLLILSLFLFLVLDLVLSIAPDQGLSPTGLPFLVLNPLHHCPFRRLHRGKT